MKRELTSDTEDALDGGELERGTHRNNDPSPRSLQLKHDALVYALVVVSTVIFTSVVAVLISFIQQERWEASLLARFGRPNAFAETFTDPAYVERILRTVTIIANRPQLHMRVRDQIDPASSSKSAPVGDVDLGSELTAETEVVRFEAVAEDSDVATQAASVFAEAAEQEITEVYPDLEMATLDPIPELEELKPPLVLHGIAGGVIGLGIGLLAVALIRRQLAAGHAESVRDDIR